MPESESHSRTWHGLMTGALADPDSTLTVLHILGPLRRSGAEMMFLRVVSQLRDEGIHTIIVSMDGSAESEVAREFNRCGAEVLELSSTNKVRMATSLMRLLRSTRPDCVHVHAEHVSIVTMCMPALLRIRVVRTVHNAFGFEGWLRARKQIERRTARLAGVHFVAVSPSVRVNENERFSNDCQLILNWSDQSQFSPPSVDEKRQARCDLGIDDHISVIAVVGNCSEVKNHQLLIRAMAGIPERHRPLLLHAGDDGGLRSEHDLAAELSVEESIRFLGSVSDVTTVLHAADLFVMPSRYEGLSVAALEALATGLRVVATDVPGLRDLPLYSSGVTLVECETDALGLAIARMLNVGLSDGDRRALADEIHKSFGSERGIAQYVRAYRGTDES